MDCSLGYTHQSASFISDQHNIFGAICVVTALLVSYFKVMIFAHRLGEN